MDPLSWTGKIAFLDPVLFIALGLLAISVLVWILLSAVLPEQRAINAGNGSLGLSSDPRGLANRAVKAALLATTAVLLAYLILGMIMGTGAGIIGAMAQRFLPVWIALALLFTLSIRYKRRLGLYGKLFDSPIGMIGFALVMFWVFTGFFWRF